MIPAVAWQVLEDIFVRLQLSERGRGCLGLSDAHLCFDRDPMYALRWSVLMMSYCPSEGDKGSVPGP